MAFLSNSIHYFEQRTHATLYYCVSAHIIDALNSRLADNIDENRLQSQALYLTCKLCHERGLSGNDDNEWCGGRQWFWWERLACRLLKLAELVLMASDSLKGALQFPEHCRTSHLLHSCTPNIPPVNAHYVTIKEEFRPSLGQTHNFFVTQNGKPQVWCFGTLTIRFSCKPVVDFGIKTYLASWL